MNSNTMGPGLVSILTVRQKNTSRKIIEMAVFGSHVKYVIQEITIKTDKRARIRKLIVKTRR